MPVRDFRRRAPPVALCRAHRWNGAQPDQSGRCAARTGLHQLVEADLDLLRTLRGVYLRRSLVSVEESGCDARTKRMTKETLMSPEFDKRIPAALLILRFFLGTFLLQWSIVADVGGFAALFLMREWDTWTIDGWRQSPSRADQAMRP